MLNLCQKDSNVKKIAKSFKNRSCSTKKRFRSHEEAKQSKSTIRNNRDVKLRVYECELCKGYHLTKGV